MIDVLGTVVHLRGDAASFVVDLRGPGSPVIAYWGAPLGQLTAVQLASLVALSVPPFVDNLIDTPVSVGVIPEAVTGWMGAPGVRGSRSDGTGWATRFALVEAHLGSTAETTEAPPGAPDARGGDIDILCRDAEAGLALRLEIRMDVRGLLRLRAGLLNEGLGEYALGGLDLVLPLPHTADRLMDFSGRWSRERQPQQMPFSSGVHLRENRRGRTGADAGTQLIAGRQFVGGSGELFAIHVAYSGNHRYFAERMEDGQRVIGGGELLHPGEVVLASGEEYVGPWIFAAHAEGLDAIAALFHEHLRSRPQHPRTPRPVTLNVWEAVYFDHRLEKLIDLARRASALGVERYVLDDGWFRGRRSPHAALGDWSVDGTVWPGGLDPLVDEVRALGMQFGLWFEPEMVSPDSDLARAHPDWIMAARSELPPESRHQQVLDLANPDAFAYVKRSVSDLIREYRLDYIKWDHNRDLIEAGHGRSHRAGVHDQTVAVYRLLDELREEFPSLEIESCSSGGARVDLGILERTDRVWASDCIDPLERQSIQRWTSQLVPLELMGAHIASDVSHTTHRRHSPSFRAITALFGHLGLEMDLTVLSAEDEEELRSWIAVYRAHRDLLHSGVLHRDTLDDGARQLTAVVGKDGREALVSVCALSRTPSEPPQRVTVRGLRDDLSYTITPVNLAATSGVRHAPGWWAAGAAPGVPGAVIAQSGFHIPLLHPESAILLHLVADSPSE